MTMPYVAFVLRMRAAATRQLTLIGTLRAADNDGPAAQEYIDGLHHLVGEPSQTVFALVQSSEHGR